MMVVVYIGLGILAVVALATVFALITPWIVLGLHYHIGPRLNKYWDWVEERLNK